MRTSVVAALAGLLPVIAVHAAFWININAGLDACFPYFEGCYSVSRATRSGQGLFLFKILALPSAAMMAWCWILTARWLDHEHNVQGRREKLATMLGVAGAVFFLIYALWLGTEGDFYRWLRRYGVVFYFGFTGLAQLLLSASLWRHRRHMANGFLQRPIMVYFLLVSMMWVLGIASAFKRKLIDDPVFLDRVENALEWNFALAMSLAFVALALVHRAWERQLNLRVGY